MSQLDDRKLGTLVIISGPSGSGKTTIVGKLINDQPEVFGRVITATTRKQREGEVNGVDYHFYQRNIFEEMIESGGFLEHAEVFGNLYGTPMKSVMDAVATHQFTLLPIDVQGHALVRKWHSQTRPSFEIKSIMISVKFEELRNRLTSRGGMGDEEIGARLAEASREMSRLTEFDRTIFNNDGLLDMTITDIVRFLGA